MDLVTLFESKAKQLFWEAVDVSHVTGAPLPVIIEPGQAYFSIRLSEMYLASARRLWNQIYPMVHCDTQYGANDDQTVVSPVEFSQLGDVNLNRIVNNNILLSGPNPYNGEEVSILAGLYSVPGYDAAKALIDLLSSLAALDPLTITETIALTSLLKGGVESVLGLDQATLHLGIRESFSPGSKPLSSGFYLCIDASEASVDRSQLWVVNGRLQKGKDAPSSTAYTDYDYMLLAIEQLDHRDDWQQLQESDPLSTEIRQSHGRRPVHRDREAEPSGRVVAGICAGSGRFGASDESGSRARRRVGFRQFAQSTESAAGRESVPAESELTPAQARI